MVEAAAHPATQDAAGPFVVADGLSVRRGPRNVLDSVSLELVAGRVYALVGPNGSGKSTLLHALAGLVPCRGSLTVAGPAALMTTHAGYHRDRTLRDHLRIIARLPMVDRSRLDDLVRQFLLTDLLDRRPRTMSLGQQRSIGLLAPLASTAPLVLLDEPFLALDAQRVATLERLICELARAGRLVVVSSHELAPLARCSSQLVALAAGRVAYTGTITDLIAQVCPRRVLVNACEPHRLADVVEGEWAIQVRREADGRLVIAGREMAEVLALCHRHGLALTGIWDDVITLDEVIHTARLGTEVAA